jgi:uncharacterized membrane protein
MKKKEIKIQRIKHFLEYGGMQSLNIFVDGNKVDSINQGETKTIYITQGIHSLYVEQQHCTSNSLVIDTQDSDSLEVESGTWLHGWKMLFILYYILAHANFFYIRKTVRSLD